MVLSHRTVCVSFAFTFALMECHFPFCEAKKKAIAGGDCFFYRYLCNILHLSISPSLYHSFLSFISILHQSNLYISLPKQYPLSLYPSLSMQYPPSIYLYLYKILFLSISLYSLCQILHLSISLSFNFSFSLSLHLSLFTLCPTPISLPAPFATVKTVDIWPTF